MLHNYHVIYSIHYYTQFHITMVGLGTYYPWIWGSACSSYFMFSSRLTRVTASFDLMTITNFVP